MTVSGCTFSPPFLDDLAETEDGLRLDDFDIVAGIESPRLVDLCQAMFREAIAPGFASSVFADATGTAIALEIARYNGARRRDDRPLRGGLAPWQLQRLESYVNEHLSDELTVGELARLLGMSVRHLSRVVRKTKGMSIGQWIAQGRFLEARRLLLETDFPVSVIANRTGFRSTAAFSTAFRVSAGCTPSTFRRL